VFYYQRVLAGLSLFLICGLLSATPLPYGVAFVSSNVYGDCSPATNSIVSGACESSDVLLLPEKRDYLLANPVGIDIGSEPGMYNSDAQLLSGVVWPAGAIVSSYFVHFDPVGAPVKSESPSNDPSLSAGVVMIQFEPWMQIAGIQVLGGSLNRSANRRDSIQLRINGLAYDTDNAPGMEFGVTASSDWIQIVDARTILFKLDVSGGNVDDLRILMETPEPASMGLMGLGLLGIATVRRRRSTRGC
jgi:hypothetical protein